ncbi:MAG: hypothetical protein K6F32_07140 [Bacilli bacterium]|nr:hypothetical protein [Bacilli bacterium]
MNGIAMTKAEMRECAPGEALTLATVFLVFTVVILTVAAYKMFVAKGAKITLPGGYKFEWTSAS